MNTEIMALASSLGEDELPKHNPLCDARQSARLLIEAFSREEV